MPAPEAAVPAVEETKPVENKEQEEAAPEEEKTEEAPAKKVEEETYEDEEEEEEPQDDEEEWVSEEEVAPRRRGRRAAYDDDDDDDEEYGRSKRRRVVVVKKPVRARNVTANEPAGMKALRSYTSALKLGPRCFRGLNKIANVKDREAELISRLHECGRSWAGEYPSPEEILLAKEEIRQKKVEKEREFIIENDTGVRKAAQKAREFVKTLGEEEDDNEEADADVDAEVEADDNKDEE